MIFDEARDDKLFAAGTHFYCHGHLTAVPISEQSANHRYCKTCYQILQVEKRTYGPGDYWTENGMVFIHYGKKYGVTAKGQTTCIGPVNDCQKEEEAFIQDTSFDEVKPLRQEEDASVTAMANGFIPSVENVTDKCLVCGSVITGKRADSRFCSNSCRQKHYRGKERQLVMPGVK
jgi:hypothetical protein